MWKFSGNSARTRLFFAAAIVSAIGAGSTGARAEEPEEMPVAYRCSGNEPSWSLSIEGPKARYTAMGEEARELSGTFRSLDYAGLFVYRGRPSGGDEWVAFVLRQSCDDTMAEEGEGGGRMPFAIGLSLPGGDARIGCCRPQDGGGAGEPKE